MLFIDSHGVAIIMEIRDQDGVVWFTEAATAAEALAEAKAAHRKGWRLVSLHYHLV